MKRPFCFFVWLLLAWLMPETGWSDDSLPRVMQRMRSDKAVRIAYRETRTLELMDQPWRGSGYMYSLPPDLMIKEQLQPERLLMAVKGEQMFYFDPVNDVRHHDEMSEDNPLSLNIGVFRALINADEALLHRLYRADFSQSAHRWSITLKPKQDSASNFSIVISGSAQKQADTVQVRQPDGDFSEFSLQPDAEGDEVAASVNRLYRELVGEQ
jgi:hypothetical protein